MIKVNSSSPEIVFLTDSEFNQPSCSGAVQWNGTYKRLEVSNGTTWVPIDNTLSLHLSPDVKTLLEWAKKKMIEEKEIEELAKTNSAISDLVTQIKEKKSQLEMVKTLIKRDNNYPQNVVMQAP